MKKCLEAFYTDRKAPLRSREQNACRASECSSICLVHESENTNDTVVNVPPGLSLSLPLRDGINV